MSVGFLPMSVWTQLRGFARPSLPEPVEPKVYQRIERLCSWLPLVLIAMNLSMLLNPDLDRPEFMGFLWTNLPVHPLTMLVSLWALKFARRPSQHRAVIMIIIVLIHWSNVSGMRLERAATMNALFMCVTLVFTRMMTDARLGLFALGSAMVEIAGMQAAIAVGIAKPAHYLMSEQAPPWTLNTAITIVGWSWLMLALTWMVSSYVANRFRSLAHEIAQERLQARRTVAEALVQAGHGRLKGTVLAGKYHLRELLGRGGMGEVYEADRVEDGKVVAVKVLFPHLAEMDTVIERFRREALAAQKVSARFAPELIELGQDGDGTHFIVMERLHGEDLATLLRRAGYLSPEQLTPIVDGIARALEAAHANNIVHRDLKPQNVFVIQLDGQPAVRLLDFGIARLRDGTTIETLTAEAQVLGTPGFMAPEQARGAAAEIGPHTDVFALAAITYRALTGKPAFPARTAAEAIFESLNHTPPPPSSVRRELPAAIDAVITIGLSKAVADRYDSAPAFAHDFELAANGQLPAEVLARAGRLPDTPDPYRVTEGM